CFFFFFQAEDGIRDGHVTGVQTCALPIFLAAPLIAGNNLTAMTDDVKSILMNKDVIAIDQDALGKQGDRLYAEGPVEIWAKPLRSEERRVGKEGRARGEAEREGQRIEREQ